jgi:hypothetical protein
MFYQIVRVYLHAVSPVLPKATKKHGLRRAVHGRVDCLGDRQFKNTRHQTLLDTFSLIRARQALNSSPRIRARPLLPSPRGGSRRRLIEDAPLSPATDARESFRQPVAPRKPCSVFLKRQRARHREDNAASCAHRSTATQNSVLRCPPCLLEKTFGTVRFPGRQRSDHLRPQKIDRRNPVPRLRQLKRKFRELSRHIG